MFAEPHFVAVHQVAEVPYPGGPIIAIASFTLAHEMEPASPMRSLKEITVDLFSPLSADTLLGTALGPTRPAAA